jgi:protein-L-isoaspartate(D-aspartate) O-methyltransferase
MLDARRRFYAEELEAVCRLRSPALVDAFAAVPRERFLPSGPWTVSAEGDFMAAASTRVARGAMPVQPTPDDDPARVYHNIAIAIDPSRHLFNGQPGTLAVLIEALALTPGARVLHVGCGLGYYTAVMAHCVGPAGRIVAFEVDRSLAIEARANLAATPWVEVRHDDASQPLGETFDAILISTIGKGLVLALNLTSAGEYAVRVLSVVAIYSAAHVRDEALNNAIGAALMEGPMKWQAITRLRRDAHERSGACWLHGPTFCFGAS